MQFVKISPGPMERPLLVLLILYLTCNQTSGQDPCLEGNHRHLTDLVKRSPTYKMDSSPLCDRYITEAWYRTKYHVMSTSSTALQTCGTTYPVWLKGSTPSDGASISMTACEVGFFGDCERQYTIDVKNCSDFLVYKLKPLDLCNAAYCFEHGDECVNDTVSNVRVSFHNVTWKTQEHATVTGLFRHDPYINLLCSFTPSADDTLLYHIDWYVDNDIVIRGQTVDKDSLQDAILSAEDLINANKKINSWIHCVVGIKAAEVKRPCFSKPSELFFAGIEILNETVTLQRSGSGHVMLRPTIPIIAPTLEYLGNPQASMVNVELSISNNNNGQCRVKHRDCEQQIEVFPYGDRERYNDPNNWRKVYPITVQSLDDAKYDLPGTHLVQRLNIGRVEGGGGSIYSNVPLHDVRINVVENNSLWKGRICGAYADVHMRSLDGYKYECQAMGCVKEKTYILYRNKDHLQEVQVRHMTCWTWLSTTCVCAVAIRVGRDVFTIDACNGGRIINFPSCYENALKVVKESDTIYKVTFPTGTLVKIRLFRRRKELQWYINVEVYPTVRDVLRTDGLCGSLDGNQTNDLRHRNGIEDDITSFDRSTHPNSFSVSWQAESNEDLLSMSTAVYDQLLSLSANSYKLCLCNNSKIYCSFKKFDECATKTRGKEYHCILHSSSRNRREVRNQPGSEILQDDDNVLQRTKRQVMSENVAFDACNVAFQQSAFYNTCLESVSDFTNETLENCIIDLTMTGELRLIQLHLDTALGQCQDFILLNYTLQTENPNVTTIVVNLCPNDCSNNGLCSEGICTCNPGYGGSDCSFDVSSPPTITQLVGDGVCDKSVDACNDVTLYGQYFVENMGTNCYFTREEINGSNSVMSATSYSVNLEERTLFEGYCSLQYGPATSWITAFRFNLSNEGTQYSENYTVYVYQSQCQTFQNDSGAINFSLQDGYCFINGKCIQSGTYKSNSSCWRCQPQIDAFEWSWDCNSTETSIVGSTTATISTIAATITTTAATATATTTATTTNTNLESSTISSTTSEVTTTDMSSSATQVVISSSFISTSEAGTSTTLKTSGSDQIKAQEDKSGQLTPSLIALISVVAFVATVIVIASVILFAKWMQGKQKKGLSTHGEAYHQPRNSKQTTTTGHLASNNLLHFESSNEKLSRAPTCSSVRTMSPTNDLSKIYDQKKQKKGLSTHGEAYHQPRNSKQTTTTGHLASNNLLHFESSNEKLSRAPTCSSVRTMSPTNDLSKIYDQKYLDQLFGVPR